MEKFTVYSPWAKSDYLEKRGITKRLSSLVGKTIGMYSSFKEYHPYFMEELERQMREILPDTEFSHYTYIVDQTDIHTDKIHYADFKEWISNVDAVVGIGADMGSCALYMGYNFAHIESLGVPAVLLAKQQYITSAQKGAGARRYPTLRIVTYDGPGFVPPAVDCKEWTIATYKEKIADMIPQIIEALTKPLTDEEENPKAAQDHSEDNFTGSVEEINDWYYSNGWTNGSPIGLPTRENIDEMLKGTDLSADYVVAELPPMLGKATVEKIAINGILAGCKPTYMPLLIAAVEAMNDDKLYLEGWTCSNATWMPTAVISGPIRNDIGINTDRNLVSPYTRPQACIGKAIAYMIMNIGGTRSRIEDMSGPGSDGRFGIVLAENEEESPWDPLQTDYGYSKDDSAITLFWPSEHTQIQTVTPSATLKNLCKVWHGGFDVGIMIVLPPENAKMFADKGYSKKDILEYVKEYNRRPSTEIPRAAIGNNHPREGLIFPEEGLEHSARLFWNTEHMFLLVGGRDWGQAYLGGGDHGGPVCKKANLPKNWDELIKEYPGTMPKYLDY